MVRIGVLCPSEIAFRRFLPSLQKQKGLMSYTGVAVSSVEERFGEMAETVSEDVKRAVFEKSWEKAKKFQNQYGGKIFRSYQELITSDEIDAVYLPLPPALHFPWAKLALENGKHVFCEKPCTIHREDTEELVRLAKERHLALHENYMFIYHKQLNEINRIVENGEIGSVRLYRISFGFPLRQKDDFRYRKELGGGALLDCGGYTLKYASFLLGNSAALVQAQMNGQDGFEVDMYGSAVLVNESGLTAQVAFGMDNDYRCELEVWGSKGRLVTGRVLTAPDGFEPEYQIIRNGVPETGVLPEDDSFGKSMEHFLHCISEDETRNKNYQEILKQAELVETFLEKAGYRNP